MRVLVTGASGTLGSAVVPRLTSDGHQVIAMSRRDHPSGDVEWRRAHLATGAGLAAALAGSDVVVHLASAPYQGGRTRRVDIEGTWRLGAAARDVGVGHLLYVSIVGVDRVPFGYYRVKLAAEEAVQSSGVAWTVLRATQFFELLDLALSGLGRLPVVPVDRALLGQPVDPRDVAGAIGSRLLAGPLGAVEEYGGPETMTFDALADQWLAARKRRRATVGVTVPGAFGRAVRAGYLTTDARPTGEWTWRQWLQER